MRPLLMLCLARVSAARLGANIGIDLGTTHSAIAILASGASPSLLLNKGSPTTPSIVGYTAEGVVVGEEALVQTGSNVENTVCSSKRFMGKRIKEVAIEASRVSFEVSSDERGNVEFLLPALPAPLTPEEVGAQVLIEMIRLAEAAAPEQTPITRAVLTVPAYFSEEQRQATRTAARLAGLTDLTLLPEPVAAALAYGLKGHVGKVLVFDLGAGTFDVSILSLCADGNVEVILVSSLDPFLPYVRAHSSHISP